MHWLAIDHTKRNYNIHHLGSPKWLISPNFLTISTERSRVWSQTCPRQLLVRVAKSDHRKFFPSAQAFPPSSGNLHSRSQLLCRWPCVLEISNFLRPPPIESHLFTCAIWMAGGEWKIGKGSGLDWLAIVELPSPVEADRQRQGGHGDSGHINTQGGHGTHRTQIWDTQRQARHGDKHTWGQGTHRGDMGHTLDTQRDMRRT